MDSSQEKLLRDRYRIISLLGQGGMGAVHLAYDTALDIQVAVKSNHNADEGSQLQFQREARLLATLRHPNLPRVIDHFIAENTQYLVMDYIPGKDLETLLQEDGIPPFDRIIDWVSQLGSALNYLHTQDPPVIHRDIKPANVKITPDGQAILVDFGLAKASDPSQATAAGATGYTPGYAPPEQYGGAHTGPYSDQYSLAATLYKLLTNQKPTESIKRLLGEAVLTPMKGLNPAIPDHIEAVIEQAVSLQPEDRFDSILGFVEALSQTNFQATVRKPIKTEALTRPAVDELKEEKKPSRGFIFTCLGVLIAGVILVATGFGIWYFVFRDKPETAQQIEATTPVAIAPEESATPTKTAQPPSETPETTSTATPPPTATVEPSSTEQPTATSTPWYLVDENEIAFSSNRGDGSTFQIWTMRVGQTMNNEIIALDLEQRTFDELNKFEPEWSPDGTKIIYSAPGSTGDNLQVWVLDLSVEGGDQVQLTNLDGNNTNPTWSPDGEMIAFSNFGRFTDVHAMYMMNADGSNLSRLSLDFQETDPAWTPDMEWLMFIIHARDHDYFFWRNKTADYSTPEPYDPTTHFGRLGSVDDPAFSADGTYLAYTRFEGESKQIWTVEFVSRGASTILLTADYFTESQPSWSPDGQWIAFTSERDGNQEIYVMTSVGLLQSNISQNAAQDMQPDWKK